MSFKDISEKCFTPEQIESINFISATGIMNGYTDGSFRPHNNLTNAELCKILYEIIATDSQEAPSFPQTYITDHWAAQYINFVLNEFPPIAKCEYNCIFPAKCELKSWSDEPSSSQYSRKLFNLLFTQYSTFKIQEISDKIITRLEISEWIYQFAKSIWSEQKETDSWEDLVCEWGEKSFNQKYHLNLYLFFYKIMYKFKDTSKYEDDFYFLRSIFHLISASDRSAILKQYQCLHMLPKRVDNIYDSLHAEIKNIDVNGFSRAYQYTNIASLYAMLKHSRCGASNSVYLHLSNVAYLNDPAEGSILLEELSGKEASYAKTSIQTSDTFIASLISSPEELLPMWVQYADNAKGCRIEFTLNQDEIKEFKRVIYVSPDQNSVVKDLINQLNSVFPQKKQTLVNYLNKSLDKIRFLFKSSYYQYESEIRLIDNVKPENAKLLTDPDYIQSPEDIPRLYVNSKKPFKIKSIMLGPKCPNPEKVALYLHSQGIENVQRSSIEFR